MSIQNPKLKIKSNLQISIFVVIDIALQTHAFVSLYLGAFEYRDPGTSQLKKLKNEDAVCCVVLPHNNVNNN